MINMLKVIFAVFILVMILAFAFLGKDFRKWFVFRITKESPVESFWIWSIALVLVVGLALAGFLKSRPMPNLFTALGVFVFFVGGVLQVFVKRRLGVVLQEKLEVAFNRVTSIGIYSKIRHPSKLACLLMLIGFCMALKSYWGLIVLFTLYLPSLFFKINQEERILLDEFGEKFFEYQDRTRKIF